MCPVDLTEVYWPALFNGRSKQLGLSAGVVAELETGWNLDTKSRRDKSSSELRTARPKILMANSPCPLFLKLQNRNSGRSIQLESTESTVITTRSHFIFAVREFFEQMHLCGHFIFEHTSNASSWNELCKLLARSSEPGVNVFLVRSISGIRLRGSVGVAWR